MAENIYSEIERLDDRLDDQEGLFNTLSKRLDKLENPVKVVYGRGLIVEVEVCGLASRLAQLERMEHRLKDLAEEEGRKPWTNGEAYTLWDKIDNIANDKDQPTSMIAPPPKPIRFCGYSVEDIEKMEDFKCFLRRVIRDNWNKSPQIWYDSRFELLEAIDDFLGGPETR